MNWRLYRLVSISGKTLCMVWLLSTHVLLGDMLAFRGLCMVKGPVDGADKKGHAIAIEKFGMIGDKIYGIPVYAYWSSEDKVRSSYLGYGWRIPLFESCILPLDENRFEMRRPDGGVEFIVRDGKDKNKLHGRRYWSGEVRGDDIRIFTTKDCRHGQSELVFRRGRLVRIKDGALNATLTYRGRHFESMVCNGKEVMRLSRAKDDNNKWELCLEAKETLCLVVDKASFPLPSQKKVSTTAMTSIMRADGSKRTISYGIDKAGNGIVQTMESRVVWDVQRRKILAKDDWTYEIREPTPAWNNVPIRRFNKNGETEGFFHDLHTGIQTREMGYSKIVMRLFTSGALKGKARWTEHYYKGELQGRGEYSYDENGGLVYSKSFGRSPSNGKKEVMETWCEPNGHVLKTRKNGDNSSIQEYIYTPEGRRVAVICGNRIVSEDVGNAKEFVAWHRARQQGAKIPMPKIVEWKDMPLPEHIRKSIPPELLQELKDGW